MSKTAARSLLTACSLLTAAAASAAPPEAPATVDTRPASTAVGDWLATLDFGAIRLRMVLHLRAETDRFVATLDSPDQNATGIPVASVVVADGRIVLDVAAVAGRFDGRIDPTAGRIAGVWSQRGAIVPAVFARLAPGAGPAAKRPQTPLPPFPYAVEEVRIPNGATGILAGTLTRPTAGAPIAAILLVAGSGPNDRDETIAGHKPFLVLAERLTRAGFVVLRYDKRGVGGSSGDPRSADLAALTADARVALAHLAGRPEAASLPLGILGHSEGGLIAAAIAAEDRDLAFVVGLAAPGLSGRRLLPLQKRAILTARGVPEARIAEILAIDATIFDAILDAPSGAAADAVRTALASSSLPPAAREAIVADAATPWMRSFLAFDPAERFARAGAPLLALYGTKDLQVPAADDVAALTAARARHAGDRIVVLPGLNHLFQTAGSGLPEEYAGIEETQSPLVADLVVEWVKVLAATRATGSRP